MVRNKVRPDANGMEQLCSALCQIRDQKQMDQFLNEIMTLAELHDLTLRWELMRKLSLGIAQRQIASEMGISLCKITRGAKVLKNKDSITRKFLIGKKVL
ncbi:MAG: Trp family transcriptional regulator [Anaerohalosphaeraceae bacterium]